MGTVQLILVGGFLGAGKTTLLWEAARRLAARGKRIGLLTNDQAPDLVDTALLAEEGLSVREVHGSCFCCNFPGLIRAAEELRHDIRADVLIAEPVGSCTDLSATILQPLKDKFAQDFVLSPFSVLADPFRLKEALTGDRATMHPSAAYIFRKQLEEADILVLNKVDLLYGPERDDLLARLAAQFPGTEVLPLSAQGGEGVEEWLSLVLCGRPAGRSIAHVDYDTYAEGEAAFGWLNAAIDLAAGGRGGEWRGFCRRLMESLRESFRRRRAEVGHVKLILSCPGGGRLLANLTRTGGEVTLRGRIDASPAEARLLLNARVEMPPGELESVVREALAGSAGADVAVRVAHMQSLTPGRPRPTHRYGTVV